MNLIDVQQLTAWLLLTDFLFGMTCGIVGGAVIGSRRGALAWPAADGPVSAGARVIFGTWTRGYPRPAGGQPSTQPPGDEYGPQRAEGNG